MMSKPTAEVALITNPQNLSTSGNAMTVYIVAVIIPDHLFLGCCSAIYIVKCCRTCKCITRITDAQKVDKFVANEAEHLRIKDMQKKTLEGTRL